MVTCPKCGSRCEDFPVGRLFDHNDNLTQESFQCSNLKCGYVVDIAADPPA